MALALAALALFGTGRPALAQGLESALSPGPLIQGHAKVEAECARCHVRFDRQGQDRLCVDCHKEVGRDLRERSGWHGRQAPQPCRACHTDHRGRGAQIVSLQTRGFDHAQTDYLLQGRHADADCKACHPASRKYREAPRDCLACHRDDDRHKGSLGVACADCHGEQGWKPARLDHSRTRFALLGRHAEARCDACHKSAVYSEAPEACVECHRKDDRHKARYGAQCENCHNANRWATVTFRHDIDTRYALRGKHRAVNCDSCHTGILYRDKAGTACNDCHRKDDKHKASLGSDCMACHNERGWTEVEKFDHDRSRFPLRGGHLKPGCKDCHATPLHRQTPSDCLACHRKDDRHEGTLGTACADCHSDADWKASRFDHARTRFALRQGHAVPRLRCADCHASPRSYRNTALECIACHRKDDRHEAQLGTRCESCHLESDWRRTRFDHAGARFALTGAHARVECRNCHASARYRDAARDCAGCHRKDDRHEGRFGERCESCHGVRDWRLGSYDHERRADWRLDGAHARVRCEACHTRAAPAGRAAAALGRDCLSCHRRDDVHDGGFGNRCETCHAATRWKDVSRRSSSSELPGPRGLARAGDGPPGRRP